VHPDLRALPRQSELLRVITSSVNGDLRASTRGLVRAPDSVAASSQTAVHSRKPGAGAHARIACQRAANDSALAFRAGQCKTISGISRRESRAGASRVPRPLADDTSLLAAINFHIDVPLPTERCTGRRCARRRGSTHSCARRGRLTCRLGEVLDARLRAGRLRAIWVRGHEFARLQAAAHIVVVPDLIQLSRLATQCYFDARALRSKCVLDRGECVCLAAAGHDACGGEPVVGRKCFEEGNGAVEVVDYFFGRLVLGVAFRLERADAGPVLGPFVVPEGFVVARVVFPVGLHKGEGVVCAERLQDRRDVAVGARGVAVCVVGAVAAVRPMAVSYCSPCQIH
jgi:hypothetical protein